MFYFPCLYDAKVGLLIFFVYPQITKHFSLVAVKWHPIFPRFGNILIVLKDTISQRKQIAFNGFLFFKKVIIDVANDDSSVKKI